MHVSTAPLLPDRPRAIVIGAGIAGLAASLRLSLGGMQVTLLERHAHLGGKIRTLPSAAGPVDAGPTVLTMRRVFDELFEAAGTRLKDHVTLVPQEILARHFWPDGSRLDLFADPARSRAAIADFAGTQAAEDFARFHSRTAKLFDAFDAPMMQAAKPDLRTLVPLVLRRPDLLHAMAPLSTMKQSLTKQFRDRRLAQLFGRYATYVGGTPHLSPALLSLIWQAEASGVWVVEGGMHKLAEALGALAQDNGVAVRTNAHVSEITLTQGHATGVQLHDRAHLEGDSILYAGDPRALATGSMGTALKSVAPQTAQLPRSLSARVYSFAAAPTGHDLAHHNVFFAADPDSEFTDLSAGRIPRDPTLYLCAEDRGQSTQPNGPERFEIIANAPANDEKTPEPELNQWHHQIMQTMADRGVSFTPTPNVTSITTPHHFATLFPATLGALYGQSPHGMTASLKRPTAQTKIPGLWLAGGGTHPGAGVPMATLSAKHAAEAILNARTLTSPSPLTAMHGGTSTA